MADDAAAALGGEPVAPLTQCAAETCQPPLSLTHTSRLRSAHTNMGFLLSRPHSPTCSLFPQMWGCLLMPCRIRMPGGFVMLLDIVS